MGSWGALGVGVFDAAAEGTPFLSVPVETRSGSFGGPAAESYARPSRMRAATRASIRLGWCGRWTVAWENLTFWHG
jgi:hypothetical protein